MQSVPLLVARRGAGIGPRVPIRNRFSQVRVEGLASSGKLVVHTLVDEYELVGSGLHDLPREILRGEQAQAELLCPESCVTCWLEGE